MTSDTVLAEIHRTREEHARRYNYDVRAMLDDLRRRQAVSGRKIVRRPPKRLATAECVTES